MATYFMRFGSGRSLMNQMTEEQRAFFSNRCIFAIKIRDAVYRDFNSIAHNQSVSVNRPFKVLTVPFSVIHQDCPEREHFFQTHLIDDVQLHTDAFGHFKTADERGIFLTLEGQLGGKCFSVDSKRTLFNLFVTYVDIMTLQFQRMPLYANIVVMRINCTVVRFYDYADENDASMWCLRNPIGLHAENLVAAYNSLPGLDALNWLRRHYEFDAMMNQNLCVGWVRVCSLCNRVIDDDDCTALECHHWFHEVCFQNYRFCPVCGLFCG